MTLRLRLVPPLIFSAVVWSQTIVQPGAPGTSSRVITPSAAVVKPPELQKADVDFMQGMIHHHAQAVEMVALMKARTRNKALLKLGERISISQTDEMRSMRQWLEDRGKPVPMNHNMAHDMSHMDHMDHGNMMDMASMPPMPGMLTPEQMKALAAAKGARFDYLFLTGMIQHHTGALTMVEELLNTPAAGQDNQLFDFATDVDNTQTAEINIMKGMLKEIKK